jgi:hypothetical protein
MSLLLMLLLAVDKEPPGKEGGKGGKGEETLVKLHEPFEDMPIPEGGFVRIVYSCLGSEELTGATLVYRVNDGEWTRRPLEKQGGEGKGQGPFNWRTIRFEGSSDPFEFYVPSTERRAGAGRFDLQTRTLKGVKGRDTIEFHIEVTDKTQTKMQSRTSRRTIVSPAEFQEWALRKLEQR